MDILINVFPDEKVLDGLTFEKVSLKYGTGRSNTFNTPNGKKTSYRHGVMTEIGDIEVSVWIQIVEYLIQRAKENELYNNLLEWVTDTLKWSENDAERKKYALVLHAVRIFGNPAWVDYVAFNKKYRPKILF